MRVKIDIDIAAAHRTDDRDRAPRPVESRDHLSTAAPGSISPSLSDLCSPPRAAPGTAIVLHSTYVLCVTKLTSEERPEARARPHTMLDI